MDFLKDEQIKTFLQPTSLIAALEEGFRRDYIRTMVAPTRTQMLLPGGAIFLTMPCYDRSLQALGIKFVSVGEANASAGRVQADYVLLDPKTRQPSVFMQANYLTDLRTAAISAIATKLMARSNATVLGIFGTGRQARSHLQVFSEVLNFKTVLVCGADAPRSEEFARTFATKDLSVIPAVASDCASESEVICTCTTSKQPLFKGSILRPGTHLNLVGAFQPDAREVDDDTIRRARVVVDTYDGALAEAGDLLIPLGNGTIDRQHITADLHEVLSHQKQGRGSSEEVTIFKSVGHAYEDLVTAKLIFDAAFCRETAPEVI